MHTSPHLSPRAGAAALLLAFALLAPACASDGGDAPGPSAEEVQADAEISSISLRAPDFAERTPGRGRGSSDEGDTDVEGGSDSLAQSPTAALMEDQLGNWTNFRRGEAGSRPLGVDQALVAYARAHAQAMAVSGGIWHSDIASLLVSWWTVGENVGVGPEVVSIANAYDASPGHFQNLIDPVYGWTGVGVVEAGGRVWTVQVFAA